MRNPKADAYNLKQITSDKLRPEHISELVRYWQAQNGALTADGFAGPKTIAALENAIRAFPASRCWPMRALPDGREPIVTSSYWTNNPSRAQPDRRHMGVDMFYRYLPTDPPMRIGDGGRDTKFWIPPGTMAISAAAGKVKLAGPSATGFRVWVEHDGGYSTGYFHLSRIVVAPGDVVSLGQDLGEVSDNPRDRDAKHLHTELYVGDLNAYPAGSLDPEPFYAGASFLPAVEP